MSMTPEHREKMLRETRDMASALLEDAEMMLRITANQHRARGDMRQLSVTLRRWLIYNDLKTVAAPRIGRFTVIGPDHSPIYDATAASAPSFFMSAGGWAFGVRISAIVSPPVPDELLPILSDPKRGSQAMSLDNFLAQMVLAARKRWISRENVIKYVANKGFTAHSSAAETDDDRALEYISHNIAFSMVDPKNVHIVTGFKFEVNASEDDTFRFDPERVNPLLLEMLGAAHYLVTSPDMKRLIDALKAELRPPKPE